jgi:hypothetical protein
MKHHRISDSGTSFRASSAAYQYQYAAGNLRKDQQETYDFAPASLST